MNCAVITDNQHPAFSERQDISYYLNYLINSERINSIFCGNNIGLSSYEKIKNTEIFRTKKITNLESRKSELYLLFFYITKIPAIIKIKKFYVFYFSTIFPLLVILRLLGKEIVVDFRSVPIKNIFSGRLLRSLCALLSDSIVTIHPKMNEAMFLFSLRRRKYLLPLGVDIKKIKNIISTPEKFGQYNYLIDKSKYTFVHIGVIHSVRKPNDIIDAFIKLNLEYSGIRLIFIGAGPYFNDFKKYVNSKNNNNIYLPGALDHSATIYLISNFNAGITYYPRDIFNYQPALKTFEYIAAGIDVIAMDTVGNRILDGNDQIMFIKDENELFEAMRVLLTRNNEQKSNITLDQYDYEYICNKYLDKII